MCIRDRDVGDNRIPPHPSWISLVDKWYSRLGTLLKCKIYVFEFYKLQGIKRLHQGKHLSNKLTNANTSETLHATIPSCYATMVTQHKAKVDMKYSIITLCTFYKRLFNSLHKH